MARSRHSSLRTLLIGGGLVLGTIALFSRSIPYGFINYDDPAFVANNAHVQRGLTREGVAWAFAPGRDYWHPLTWLSLMADSELFGRSAPAHRAVNVGWHAINACLVFV